MRLYAIEVNEANLPLISHLNKGVTPVVEQMTTWFIFDTEDSGFEEQIITEVEFLNQFDAFAGTTIFRVE